MDSKVFIFIMPLFLCLSGCLSANKQTVTANAIQNNNTKTLQEQVVCPTIYEEARRLYNNGLAQTDSGNFQEAIKSYLKAIEIDSNYCDAMDNLGLLYRRQNNLDEAIVWYERSIKVFPDNIVPHNNLAVAYSMKGLINESISEFKTSIKINNDDPEGYYGLGNLYISINEYKLAIDNLKKSEELYEKKSSPLLSDARRQLGVSYFALQDCNTSTNYIKQIYTEKSKDPFVNYIVGICNIISNDIEEGKKYLTKAKNLGMEIPSKIAQQLNL